MRKYEISKNTLIEVMEEELYEELAWDNSKDKEDDMSFNKIKLLPTYNTNGECTGIMFLHP